MLTLAEAYAYGCPAPFVAALGTVLEPERIWERFEALGLLGAQELPGFARASGAPPAPLTDETPDDELVGAVVGQGTLTVTPLQMVQIVAAVANQGNAVPLHLVTALRPPQRLATDVPLRRPALLRADVASGLRLTMLQAAAQPVRQPGGTRRPRAVRTQRPCCRRNAPTSGSPASRTSETDEPRRSPSWWWSGRATGVAADIAGAALEAARRAAHLLRAGSGAER